MSTGWGRVISRLGIQACRILVDLQVQGADRVPSSGPAIICPNHLSVIDPMLLTWVLEREPVFWAARYLFDIPLLGWILRQGGVLPVQGTRASLEAVRQTCRLLNEGGVAVMFPQGGVRPPGEKILPHRGAAFVAIQTGAPLIPVALFGSDRVLPVGQYRPRRGRVQIRFGEPLVGFQSVSSLNQALGERTDELLGIHPGEGVCPGL